MYAVLFSDVASWRLLGALKSLLPRENSSFVSADGETTVE